VQPAVRANFEAALSSLAARAQVTRDVEWPDLPWGAAVGTIDWQIFKDNEQVGKYMSPTKPIGTAWTEVKYLGRDDLFELYGKFDFQVPVAGLAAQVKVRVAATHDELFQV
jgi:hypothetical protein